MRAAAAPLLLAVVLATASGCIAVPYGVSGVQHDQKFIDPEALKFIKKGRTTREEVLLALGAPDVVLGGSTFVYNASRRAFSVTYLTVSVFGMGTDDQMGLYHKVYVEIGFDDSARVTRVVVNRTSDVFSNPEITPPPGGPPRR